MEEGKSGKGAKLAVAVLLGGTLVFGLAVGYLTFTNSSFPVAEKQLSDYAVVTYSRFNGTEYYFRLNWTAGGNFSTLFAQLTSDEYTTPVFNVLFEGIRPGQEITMPLPLSTPWPSLHNVNLYIAVRDNTNNTEFTLRYHIDSVYATEGKV